MCACGRTVEIKLAPLCLFLLDVILLWVFGQIPTLAA